MIDLRKTFSQSLASFVPFLSHNLLGSQGLLQIASRLEISQKQHDLYDKSDAVDGEGHESSSLEVAALQLETVMDLPLVNTRAGLFIFLNSLVCVHTHHTVQLLICSKLVARPLTDNFMIVNYLHTRYKVDSLLLCVLFFWSNCP